MKPGLKHIGLSLLAGTAVLVCAVSPAQAADKKPNIVVIMGDDIGWLNVGAYHQGLMYSTTPNLDKLAADGMRFTDYYAEPSCTAGRANFITGELPIRTGLTTVGQAGRHRRHARRGPHDRHRAQGDGLCHRPVRQEPSGRPEPLSCRPLHGFDEFFGYLYHLDAMEDPFWHSYPPALKDVVGPRNLIHSFATTTDDPTEQPRWGKIGKQRIEDEGRCRHTP